MMGVVRMLLASVDSLTPVELSSKGQRDSETTAVRIAKVPDVTMRCTVFSDVVSISE